MFDKARRSVFPILAALIWGVAFVAQKNNTAGALTFNMSRSVVAFLFLLPVIALFTKGDIRHILSENTRRDTAMLWIGGVSCGTALSVATYLQQLGLDSGTEAGKASFLTAMYIVLVPVFGLFLKKKVPFNVWISVCISVGGLYLLCVKNGFSVRPSDMLIAACSVVFAVHILVIDHFSARCNGIKLSCIQFLTCAVLSGIGAFIFEEPEFSAITQNLGAVLYLGIGSSGIAYTLQIIAQKNANPTVLTILLSMESVFGVIAGAIHLHEVLLPREYIGCALVLCAVILAQLPLEKWIGKNRRVKG
ncbi:MAG: DMT family transporter [Clostridia bacterium]|nr:DMT family transporter [Clostridia bacterium]